jgi:hypothetical protein
MGADKISSPKRELGICPKFRTKDSHMSLPRSCSHTGPTNHRNKPQTIPKRKHDSRSKVISCPAKALADGPGGRGGQSARTGRTVRDPRVDGPLKATEQSAAHPETRMVCTLRGLSEGNSCHADGLRPLGGRSAKPLPARNNWPNGSKRRRSRTRDEHEEL